jgi:hypothetical protein
VRFRSVSGVARLGTRIAPAVLDWLRWKYRRLQIDRRRDDEWLRVLREDYPRRVRDAGAPPTQVGGEGGPSRPLWVAERAPTTSKRQRLDARRDVLQPQPRPLQERDVPEQERDSNALALMVAEHRGTLAPLLDKCRSENEQRTLIVALWDYLAAPTDAGTGVRWRDVVTELMSR